MPFRRPAAFVSLLCVAACGLIFGGADTSVSAQTISTWYREPAISPDGSTILFTAYGDIWSVPADGGTAVAITHDDGWEGYPVWSRDGARIAFASDRFGDLDVFVMNADGSDLTRLTFYDVDDIPSDFSPDGARVLFSSARSGSVQSSYFPTRALPQLYEVAVTGGAPRMVFTNPAREARWSPDGAQIVYREEKSYENEYRQRDVSSFARDIWIYDVINDTHRKVTDNPHGDHAPAWSTDGTALYMQSESDDQSFNVRRLDLGTGESTYLSHHGPQPARGLSRSSDGLLAYSFHGEIYTLRDGEEPRAVDIQLTGGHLADAPTPLGAPSDITEFAVSADGTEIVFVSRGEVFVTDTQFADTVRVTNTPEQERSVSFSPDGRSVLYASERDGGWALYETSLADDNEPRFSAASAFTERLIYRAEGTDAFQPLYSPDGEKVAFLYDRDEIRVVNRDGTNVHVVFPGSYNYSYADGDIHFAWSPDSNWITADYSARGYYFYADIGIAPADGSAAPRDISVNGYHDGRPIWQASGDVIFYYSERYGMRSEGQWGSQQDVIAAFLTESAWTRYNLTQQERALLAAAEENGGGGDAEEDGDEGEDAAPSIDINAFLNLAPARGEDEPIVIDFAGVEDRTARLTMHSADLADAALTSNMSALYYLAAFEGGYDLWRHDLVKDETTKVAAIGASSATLAIVPDDSRIIVLADGVLLQGEIGEEIMLAPVQVGGEVTVRENEERAFMFDHVWRQVADKFYDPAMHGLDWDAVGAAYRPKVAAINNNRDFATLMSEMLGQLNASHTGMYYRSHDAAVDDQSASLGAIYSTDSQPGLVIAEVLPDGPLDRDAFNIAPGERIVAIGGTRLDAATNPYSLLNRRTGDRVRLTIAGQGGERSVTARAYSRTDEVEALYQRWIDRRRAIVEARSGGRIGYVHIRSMDDEGYRQIFTDLFGRNFDKEAVVIDTRFNGGGWLHDQLLTLLDGEPYFGVRVRGRTMRGDPVDRWTNPSIVVMNEGNYSNAFMFPYAYSLFGIGQTVGMPVPGTGTAVWWEWLQSGDVVFGIPQVAELDQNGVPVENQELEPDILVDNPPEAAATGGDRPLEAAVDALLAELDSQQ